jgi:hypothetical protein
VRDGDQRNGAVKRWEARFEHPGKGPRLALWRPLALLIATAILVALGHIFGKLATPGHETSGLEFKAAQAIGIWSTDPNARFHVYMSVAPGRKRMLSRDGKVHVVHIPATEQLFVDMAAKETLSTTILITSNIQANSTFGPPFHRADILNDQPPYQVQDHSQYMLMTTVADLEKSFLRTGDGFFVAAFTLPQISQYSNGSFFAHLPIIGTALDQNAIYPVLPVYISQNNKSLGRGVQGLIEFPLPKSLKDRKESQHSRCPPGRLRACNYNTPSGTPHHLFWAPAVLSTAESLDRVRPLFADAEIISTQPADGSLRGGKYVWTGSSLLEPTLNLAHEASLDSEHSWDFRSGIAYGVAAAAGVAFIQEVPKSYPFSSPIILLERLRRKRRKARQPGNPNETGGHGT